MMSSAPSSESSQAAPAQFTHHVPSSSCVSTASPPFSGLGVLVAAAAGAATGSGGLQEPAASAGWGAGAETSTAATHPSGNTNMAAAVAGSNQSLASSLVVLTHTAHAATAVQSMHRHSLSSGIATAPMFPMMASGGGLALTPVPGQVSDQATVESTRLRSSSLDASTSSSSPSAAPFTTLGTLPHPRGSMTQPASNAAAAALLLTPSSSTLTLAERSSFIHAMSSMNQPSVTAAPDYSSASDMHASSASSSASFAISPSGTHRSSFSTLFSPSPTNTGSSSASSSFQEFKAALRSTLAGITAPSSRFRQKREHNQKDFENVQKQWREIISHWNEYVRTPSVVPKQSAASTATISSRTLASNQKKLSRLLWAHGIPSNLRGSIWLLLIGNALQLTPMIFEELKQETAKARVEYSKWKKQTNSMQAGSPFHDVTPSANISGESGSQPIEMPYFALFSAIDQDLPRTFPELAFFHAATNSLDSSVNGNNDVCTSAFHPVASASSATPGGEGSEATAAAAASTTTEASASAAASNGGLTDQDDVGSYALPLRLVLECCAFWRMKHVTHLRPSNQRVSESPSSSSSPDPQSHVAGDPVESSTSLTEAVSSTSTTSLSTSSAQWVLQSGYVQGMSFLASILFLSLGDDAFLCFLCLTNLLENPLENLSSLFAMDARATQGFLQCFQQQFQKSLPRLYQHLTNGLNFTADMYIYRWIFSVYSQSLQLDTVFRIWDVFLWESFKDRGLEEDSDGGPGVASPTANAASPVTGSTPSAAASTPCTNVMGGFAFLFRVALGILSMYQTYLLSASFEDALYFLQHLPKGNARSTSLPTGAGGSASTSPSHEDCLDDDQLFEHILSIKLDRSIWINAPTAWSNQLFNMPPTQQ